jgi:hypothetical protein
MKCIKRGKPPQNRIWIGDCLHCNSTFEALEGELDNIVNDPIDHSRMAKAKCEVCNGEFWLFPKKIK